MKIGFSKILIVFTMSAGLPVISQNDVVKELMKQAEISFEAQDYYNAYRVYRQVLASDKKNEKAVLNAAVCIFRMNYQPDSAWWLVQGLNASSLPDAKFYLAKIYHGQKKFDEAVNTLEAYKKCNPIQRNHSNEEADYILACCVNAKKFIAMPHRSMIKNLGEAVNSRWSDEEPVIMPDESAMYFTSRRDDKTQNKRDVYGNNCEDIYLCSRYNGTWQKAINAGPPINSESNDACVALSRDGQRMMVYRTGADISSGDLYMSKLGGDNKWEMPEKMGSQVNSQYVETAACFSNDSSEIYFCSNRPGGYGGKDLYRVKKLPNGNWAMPYNLGPSVNTLYDEESPFLHPDGVTLYFSSKGHDSMGEYDVFKCLTNSESGQFSKAENLGYPINDVGNDLYFVVNVNGQKGYYSSVKSDTYGATDIYEIDTRFGDNELVVRSGFATLNGIPQRLKITVLDLETKQLNGVYQSNPGTGKFILVVNPYKKYRATIQQDGYKTFTSEIGPLVMENNQPDLQFNLIKE